MPPTLFSKGRNVVLESKYGSPKIVNDGVTIAREVELEDPVENIGAKLVRQAASRTNDTAGDGTTTACVLSAAFIAEVRPGELLLLSMCCPSVGCWNGAAIYFHTI